jgi:hypothetical protein
MFLLPGLLVESVAGRCCASTASAKQSKLQMAKGKKKLCFTLEFIDQFFE